ncbi:NAD(P)H-binding protein [Natronomonas marina]|jgi:uncharacterized protein YbjT (DUF2867 family)|uniref:NAD(P)H-binding protein n=1 Tax=Natronomonas marina TaxID=2961939 RepID=UPI0020C99DBB|nr:NAD(P)H-binding protein [Natronomonas marina]
MRPTVFGATGPTGRPLVRQALDRADEVVAFARSSSTITDARDVGVTSAEGSP